MTKEKFIQKAIKKPGALRKASHVKEGENIPKSKIKQAEHSKSPTMRKRAVLAETLGNLRKKKVSSPLNKISPYKELATKLQVLGACAMKMHRKEEKLLDSNSKTLLKIVQFAITECEEYLNFKVA